MKTLLLFTSLCRPVCDLAVLTNLFNLVIKWKDSSANPGGYYCSVPRLENKTPVVDNTDTIQEVSPHKVQCNRDVFRSLVSVLQWGRRCFSSMM